VKKCKICRLPVDSWPILPSNSMADVCSIRCARIKAKQKIRADKASLRKRKEALKTHPQLVKEAQRAFNRYIRERDKYQPCICCDKPATPTANEWDAGHYRSCGGAPHLRFNEKNCHKQSKHCNRYLFGNYSNYRAGLIKRIGLDAVLELEHDNTVRKYSKDELREIKREYNRRYIEARNRNNAGG
jgi:hypothetical protein